MLLPATRPSIPEEGAGIARGRVAQVNANGIPALKSLIPAPYARLEPSMVHQWCKKHPASADTVGAVAARHTCTIVLLPQPHVTHGPHNRQRILYDRARYRVILDNRSAIGLLFRRMSRCSSLSSICSSPS